MNSQGHIVEYRTVPLDDGCVDNLQNRLLFHSAILAQRTCWRSAGPMA
jgi:hypothetical protein